MHELLDIDELARAVDGRVRCHPRDDAPARLYGVRLGDPARVGRSIDGFELVPLWSGVARELPARLRPPAGLFALALECEGWAAPMEDDGSLRARPSRHPKRRRVHHTAIVYAHGIDVSVLCYEGEEPQLLRDGVGLVLDLLVACWNSRPDA